MPSLDSVRSLLEVGGKIGKRGLIAGIARLGIFRLRLKAPMEVLARGPLEPADPAGDDGGPRGNADEGEQHLLSIRVGDYFRGMFYVEQLVL